MLDSYLRTNLPIGAPTVGAIGRISVSPLSTLLFFSIASETTCMITQRFVHSHEKENFYILIVIRSELIGTECKRSLGFEYMEV